MRSVAKNDSQRHMLFYYKRVNNNLDRNVGAMSECRPGGITPMNSVDLAKLFIELEKYKMKNTEFRSQAYNSALNTQYFISMDMAKKLLEEREADGRE